MKRVLAVTTLSLLVMRGAGAQPLAPTPQFQVSMDLVSALRVKDAAKAGLVFAEEGVLLPPNGEIVSGHSGIIKALKGFLERGSLEIAIVSLGSASAGNLGYDVGQFDLTLKSANGEKTREKGTYLTVLKLGEDSRWRVVYGSWHSSLAALAPTR